MLRTDAPSSVPGDRATGRYETRIERELVELRYTASGAIVEHRASDAINAGELDRSLASRRAAELDEVEHTAQQMRGEHQHVARATSAHRAELPPSHLR